MKLIYNEFFLIAYYIIKCVILVIIPPAMINDASSRYLEIMLITQVNSENAFKTILKYICIITFIVLNIYILTGIFLHL